MRKIRALECGEGNSVHESSGLRAKTHQHGHCLPLSITLMKKRLEATIGQHICAMWKECGHGEGVCSQPNFQNDAHQYRAFEDPLQRSLIGNHEDGVVIDVLNRIAHKQDEKLSALVLEQQTEISNLKSVISRQRRGGAESLHHQCKLAISTGVIENSTPACAALLRVLEHCSSAVAFDAATGNSQVAGSKKESAAQKPSVLSSSALGSGFRFSKPNRTTDLYAGPIEESAAGLVPSASFLLPKGELAKAQASKPSGTTTTAECLPTQRSSTKCFAEPSLAHESSAHPTHSPNRPRERSLRTEDWVRLQRVKNAPGKTLRILQEASTPAPSKFKGVGQLLPRDAPLRRLVTDSVEEVHSKLGMDGMKNPQNASYVSSKMPDERISQGISQLLPLDSPLNFLVRDAMPKEKYYADKELKHTSTQELGPPKAPKPSDCQGLLRFLPNNAPLRKLSLYPCDSQAEDTVKCRRPSWMLPAAYTPPFERSEGSIMLSSETRNGDNISACH